MHLLRFLTNSTDVFTVIVLVRRQVVQKRNEILIQETHMDTVEKTNTLGF